METTKERIITYLSEDLSRFGMTLPIEIKFCGDKTTFENLVLLEGRHDGYAKKVMKAALSELTSDSNVILNDDLWGIWILTINPLI